MADQIYTADLDTRAYEKGLAGLVDRARKAGTDLQTVFAKVDARAATAGRELGTRDSGGSLTVFGKQQKEGAEEAKRATESSSESTLKHALRFGILMKAGKMAWGVARDAMDAYGQTSAFAKGEVDSLMNVFGKFQASMGQDLVAGIGGIFGPWATNPNTWKNAWESTQRGLVDLMSGSGAYDQARAAEQKQAALAAENAAQLKSLETEKTIRATMAGIVSDKSAAADFTRAEAVAAQQLRERYTEIDKLEGLRAGRKAELQALAREEYDRAAAAALQGHAGRLQPFAEEDRQRRTPLHLAAWSGAREAAAVLLDGVGVPRDARDEGGFTPLFFAVFRKHAGLARELVERWGCSAAVPSLPHEGGLLPLHQACTNGAAELVPVLVRGVGADPPDATGATPLALALRHRHLGAFEAVLAAGADPWLANAEGNTALHLACGAGLGPFAALLLGRCWQRNRRHRRIDLAREVRRVSALVGVERGADFSRDREARRHRQPEARHLGEVRALAAEQGLLVLVTLGEVVHVLGHLASPCGYQTVSRERPRFGRFPQVKVSETVPSPSMVADAASPACTNAAVVNEPDMMNWPATISVPNGTSALASQATAAAGSPSTAEPNSAVAKARPASSKLSCAAARARTRAIAAARRAFDDSDWSTNRALRKRALDQLQTAIEAEKEDLREELIAETGCPAMTTRICGSSRARSQRTSGASRKTHRA